MLIVHLRVTDAATQRPVPVRIRVAGPDGSQYAPLGRSPEFAFGRNEDVGGQLKIGRERWFYTDGACEIALPAGVSLRVQAAKGPEWVPLDEEVTLGPGQISLRFTIARWVDTRTEGWVSVDTRCHFLSPHAALLEAGAEDLDVVNLLATSFRLLALDANTYATAPNLLAFSGQVPAVESDGRAVYVNTFNSHPVLGRVALLNSHRPVFPLAFGGEESDDWGICDWADQCHRKGGLVVWSDAFEALSGVTGGEALVAAILGKIDAIEVTTKPGRAPLLPWVYRLWDAGVLVPLVGASAKDSNATRLGLVRTYARVGEEAAPLPEGTGEEDSPPPGPLPAGRGSKAPSESVLILSVLSEAAELPLPAPARSLARSGRAEPIERASEEREPGGGLSSWLTAVRSGRTFVTAGPLLALTLNGSHATAAARAQGATPRVELVANGTTLAVGEGTVSAELREQGWAAARITDATGFAHTSPVAVGTVVRKPEAVAALLALVERTREWVETLAQFVNPKRRQALLDRCAEAVRTLGGA